MKKLFLLLMTLLASTGLFAQTYCVAGNGGSDKTGVWLHGLDWAPAENPMTNGSISFQAVPAGTWQFKVTDGTWDNNWGYSNVNAATSTSGYTDGGGNNVKFTIAAPADITIAFDGTNITLTSSVPFGEAVVTSYTIVGTENMMGSNYDINDTNNDMTLSGSVYTLTKKSVAMEAMGEYKYKLVGNHSYSVYEYPKGMGTDLSVTVDTDGTYDITFTFDPNAADGAENKLTANAVASSVTPGPGPTPTPTPTPTPGGDGKFFVAGNGGDDATGAWLGGISWDAGQNSMTNNTISFANVPAGTWQFKVTNGAWPGSQTAAGEEGQDWGFAYLNAASAPGVVNGGGNFQFTLPAAGTITISFLEGDELPIKVETTTPFGELVISEYTVVGTANIMGSEFDVNDAANNMVAAGDGSYTLVKKGVVLEETNPMAEAADMPYKYKVVGNHSYAAYEFPGAGMDQKIQVFAGSGEVEAAGTYDLTFTFNPNLPDEDSTKLSVAAVASTGVEEIAADANLTVVNGLIAADQDFQVYNLVGQNVTAQNGQLLFGTYIVKFAEAAVKVQVR